MLIAREFIRDDQKNLIDMVKEINDYDRIFEGLNNIKQSIYYDEFLKKLEINKRQGLISPDHSPQTTFGLFDNERLIGGFNLRSELKGMLLNHGGNIGYLIRPSERRKGYGTIILKIALEKARDIGLKEVLVCCRTDNIASAKIIEDNNGIYENNYYDEITGKTYRRYWISL